MTLNSSFSQVIISIEDFLEFHLNLSLSLKMWNKYARTLDWKDFPVYKDNGIPFAVHLARVKKNALL